MKRFLSSQPVQGIKLKPFPPYVTQLTILSFKSASGVSTLLAFLYIRVLQANHGVIKHLETVSANVESGHTRSS